MKALRLMVYSCPRILGSLERNDEEVEDAVNGQPWVAASRNNCKLVPKYARDEEELVRI